MNDVVSFEACWLLLGSSLARDCSSSYMLLFTVPFIGNITFFSIGEYINWNIWF